MLLIKNKAFRHLFLGRLFNVLADSMMFFSILKWIELHSNASGAFTLFYVAYYLPITLFAIPAGAWLNNKRLQAVMVNSTIIRIAVLLCFLLVMPVIDYHWAYLLLILLSVLGLIFIPASQSILPNIVDQDYRPAANSMMQLGYTAVKVIGQISTALLLKLTMTPLVLWGVSAILLICSLLFITQIKPSLPTKQESGQSKVALIKDGILYIVEHVQLRPLFTLLACALFVASSVDLLLISFLTKVLLIGVENLSFIGAASLLGIAAGASLVPRWYKKVERKYLIIPPLFGLGISVGSLFFVTHWMVILPFFFIQGVALGCFNVTFVTYLQDVVSSENYTRTFSLYNMIASAMALPGILLVGSLLGSIGVLNTILVTSGILILIGTFGIYWMPQLGKGDSRVLS
ncbi:MFS transporter [Fictibacillus iocasae]|uniref:MFS transporter n=1 Tax=Fictibacillus iocasae TaxID=2715437 RepID=A0ABW2NW11_9BACL